jgi:hypothetical protein
MLVFGDDTLDILDTGRDSTFFKGKNAGQWKDFPISDFNPIYVQKFGNTIIGFGSTSPESDKQDLDTIYSLDISDEKMMKLEEDALNDEITERMINGKGNSEVADLFLDKLLQPDSWCINYNCKGVNSHKFEFAIEDIKVLIKECFEVTKEQDVLINIECPVKVFGDIHG